MDKIFEIIEYIDGGPNDRGSVIAFVKADSALKAREILADIHNNPEIVSTGFYQANNISMEQYQTKRNNAEKEAAKFILHHPNV